MNESELLGQIKTLMSQAEQIKSKSAGMEMSVEDARTIDGILGKVDVLRIRLDNERRSQGIDEYLAQSQGTAAQHHGWRNSTPTEGDLPVDEKAWRELEVPIPGKLARTVKVRYNVPLAVQSKDYAPAFEEYMRKGFARVRPSGQKTLYEGQDSSGGFTVPEDYQVQLLKKIATITVFRQYARQVTTSRDSIKWPRVKYTTDDNYTSGVRMTWTGEQPASSTVHRVTDPVFGLIDIPVHTAMASMPITRDLLEDSAFDIEGIAADLIGEAFGLGEDNTFWNGTGAGQPLGLLTTVDATDGIASVVSGSATTLLPDGVIDLIYALPAQYEPGARIFWRKSTEKVVRQLKTASGVTEYIWPVEERVGAFGVAEPTILGFPISRAEFVPAIAGSAYPIVFGQLSGYMVVDRVGLSFQRLDELYAEQNIVVLLARKRVGGQVAEPWRLRCQKIST